MSYEKESVEEIMQHVFEKQLHEQYAINNNSNLSAVVSIIVALLAVFYGYGYVFLHTTNTFSQNYLEMCLKNSDLYTLDALVFATMATLIVTGILRHICLHLGYKQRFEQFITFALRCKYYQSNIQQMRPKIFPRNYHPFKIKQCEKENFVTCLNSECNSKHCLRPFLEEKIAQGLYGEFGIILIWLDFFVLFILAIKLFINIAENYNYNVSGTGWFSFALLIFVWIFTWSTNWCTREELRDKYLEHIIEYKEYYKYCNDIIRKN